MGDIMGRKANAAKGQEEEWDLEEEPADQTCRDRTLVLRKEPLPWKVQLMHAGVKEIRCTCCSRVKPIAGAREVDEGWLCEDCVPDSTTTTGT